MGGMSAWGAIAPKGLVGTPLKCAARRPRVAGRGSVPLQCAQLRISSPAGGGRERRESGSRGSMRTGALAYDPRPALWGLGDDVSDVVGGMRKKFTKEKVAVAFEGAAWVAALTAPVVALVAVVAACMNPQALLSMLGMTKLSSFGGAFFVRMYLMGVIGTAGSLALWEHRHVFASRALSALFKVPITTSEIQLGRRGVILKDLAIEDGSFRAGKILVRASFPRLINTLRFVITGGAKLDVDCVRIRDLYLRTGGTAVVRGLKHGVRHGFSVGETHLHHVVVDIAADHVHKLHKLESLKARAAATAESLERGPSGAAAGASQQLGAAAGASRQSPAAPSRAGASALSMNLASRAAPDETPEPSSPRTGRIALNRLKIDSIDSTMTPGEVAHAFTDILELNCTRRGNSKMLDKEVEKATVEVGWEQLLKELDMPNLGPLGNVPMESILAQSMTKSDIGQSLQEGMRRMDASARTITQLQQWSPTRVEGALRQFGGQDMLREVVRQDIIGRVMRREGRLETIIRALQNGENGLLEQIMKHAALIKTLVDRGIVVKLLDNGLVDKMMARPRVLSKVLECCVLEELVAMGVVDSLTKPENNEMLNKLVEGPMLEVLADTRILPALVLL